ncbi:MAG: LPS export ABC transporter permease LptG [Deltaproteobacteria bacterium]|nr:LPS export ABC transporter permease LptG [Deltaproteobacteria bacterium]
MKVITKYISKEVIKVFIMCQFIFILLFLVIDFIQKIDNFVKAGVPFSTTISYFLYKLPSITEQMIPVATTISVIVVICLMKKNREIMAMKACGLDIFRVFTPVIFFSIILSIFSFILSDAIIPYTSSMQNEIWNAEVKKRDPTGLSGRPNIWYKSKNNIYWIEYFDAKSQTMKGPVFYFFNDQFILVKKIKGETGRWVNNRWEIEKAKVQTLAGENDYRLEKLDQVSIDIPETPEMFIKKIKKPEDMSYGQLKSHTEKVRTEGYDNTADLVFLYQKLAFPLITAVLALLAIPIGLWEKINGIPLSITIGIAACFLLYLVMAFASAIGRAGILPPFLSAWAANILFSLAGINLIMNIKK